MTSTKQRPAQTLRDGAIKAAIWRNEGQSGAFYGVTFARTYRDAKGKLRDTDSYSGSELLRLAHLAEKAYDLAAQLTRQARASETETEEKAEA